jgi:branched-chain amino acid transport system ATP-binding protein
LIVIEHDMPLITTISDELVALELGSVIARGEPQAVVRDPRVVEGYLGTSEAAIQRSGLVTPKKATARRRKPITAAGR